MGVICYHGTDDAAAKNILREGFTPGTWFAEHLEDAIGFGGLCVFQVIFDKLTPGQFIGREGIPVERIVGCEQYQITTLFENAELRQRVFNEAIGMCSFGF